MRDRLELAGIKTFLDERNLRAGHNWPQALEEALSTSLGVAVFVGSNIGNWQWAEIGFAIDRQIADKTFPVIPILLNGAEPNRSFLFLNTWIDMRGVQFDDRGSLEKLIDAIHGPTDTTTACRIADFNPFRGLEYFDEAHAPFFFGRESTVNDLFERITSLHGNFLAVVGPSGSGKSSAVRAGLVPRLRRQRPPKETWDIAVLTPGDRPWFRLADALAPLRFPDKFDSELDIEVDKLCRALESGDLDCRSVLDRISRRHGSQHRLLIVVDQFEELFTLNKPEQRRKFLDAILATLNLRDVALLPIIRADFYGQVLDDNRTLSDLLGSHQVALGRLQPEELRRTIVEPAKLANLSFDPGLVELLLRDAGSEPGNLPLLQHALLELHSRRDGSRLTASAYETIGGIRRAIATSAELEYGRLPEPQKNVARAVFTQLVRLARADEGIEDTRRQVLISSLPGEAKGIIEEFSSARLRLLVTSQSRRATSGGASTASRVVPNEDTVEVAHEALIREWDRLRHWLNEDRGFYLWRQRLDQFFAEYADHDRNPDYLLTGAMLREAQERSLLPMPEPLGKERVGYIEASIERREREKAAHDALEQEARAAREAEHNQALKLVEAQRAHAERERQRALAQSFVDRRRSQVAIAAGVISITLLCLWALFGTHF